MLADIVPIILCRNEEANIGRAVDGLEWARRVIVLDSRSTDDTRRIAQARPNVEWHEREFDNHANQSNHALKLAGNCPWVLFMDADYVVTPALQAELSKLRPPDDVVGYYSRFRYRVRGRLLRGALYPPRLCLFRPSAGSYVQKGHTQMLKINGSLAQLAEPLIHDDRKPEATFWGRQSRYAQLEAGYLAGTRWSDLGASQKVRRLLFIAPWLVPVYALLFRGVAFDGIAGLRYAWERAIAETLIAKALLRVYLTRATQQE